MKTKLILSIVLLIAFQISFSQSSKKVKECVGIEVNQTAPNFTAKDAENKIFKLNEALLDGPVVLIFYRGYWCPICNKHLSKLQDSLQYVTEKGARIVAVSPEKTEYLNKMKDQVKSEFTLLYDEGYNISNAYDVTFKPKNAEILKYNTFLNANLGKTHTGNGQLLPIPATYVINKSGKIIWRQFDPNYKNRSNVSDIIKALEM